MIKGESLKNHKEGRGIRYSAASLYAETNVGWRLESEEGMTEKGFEPFRKHIYILVELLNLRFKRSWIIKLYSPKLVKISRSGKKEEIQNSTIGS